jgi:hypothetical protein
MSMIDVTEVTHAPGPDLPAWGPCAVLCVGRRPPVLFGTGSGASPRPGPGRARRGRRDSSPAGGAAPRPGRRVLAARAIFLGALAGALLLRQAETLYVLGVALLLRTVTSVTTHRLSASRPAWTEVPS